MLFEHRLSIDRMSFYMIHRWWFLDWKKSSKKIEGKSLIRYLLKRRESRWEKKRQFNNTSESYLVHTINVWGFSHEYIESFILWAFVAIWSKKYSFCNQRLISPRAESSGVDITRKRDIEVDLELRPLEGIFQNIKFLRREKFKLKWSDFLLIK